MKEYPFKKVPGLSNIEVENGEVIILPDNRTYKVSGRTHRKGGEAVFAPDQTRILSDYLTLPKEVVKEIYGKEVSLSPAQVSKRLDPTVFTDIKMDNSSRTDPLRRKTAELMEANLQALQNTIYEAQESMKTNKGGKNFQRGGPVGMGIDIPLVQGGSPFMFPQSNSVSPDLSNMYTTEGFSMPYPNPNNNPALRDVVSTYSNPLANMPFFTEGTYGKRGEMQGRDRQNIEQYQRAISYPERELGLSGPILNQFQQKQATILRQGERQDPDQFITKTVVMPDGTKVPLAQATDEQIRLGRTEYLNTRTGTPDLIDWRNGNFGEGTTNQSHVPIVETIMRADNSVPKLPNQYQGGIRPLDIKPRELDVRPITGPTTRAAEKREFMSSEIDPEKLYSGLAGALDIFGLATLRRSNPYYNDNTAQIATTRFDPVNTLANERSFNMAKEALERSNLPEQVKQAQLAQLQANMGQGMNQVDLTNAQGYLQVQNQNTMGVQAAQNFNTQARNQANLQYITGLGQARYIESAQRQEYLDSMLENFRNRIQNRQNIQLVNQLANNYGFVPGQGVQYTPGQGVPQYFGQLAAYQIPAPGTQQAQTQQTQQPQTTNR